MTRTNAHTNAAAHHKMLRRRWTLIRNYGWALVMFTAVALAALNHFGPNTGALFVSATFIAEVVLLVAYGRVKELSGTNASGWLTARDMGWTVVAAAWLILALLNDHWSLWTLTGVACGLIAVITLFSNFMLRGTPDYAPMELFDHNTDD